MNTSPEIHSCSAFADVVQSTSSCCCGWTFPDQLKPMTSRDPCNVPCVGAPEPFCVGQEGVTHYVTVYFTQGNNLSHRSEKNQNKTRGDRPADMQKTTDEVFNQPLEPVGLSYPDHVTTSVQNVYDLCKGLSLSLQLYKNRVELQVTDNLLHVIFFSSRLGDKSKVSTNEHSDSAYQRMDFTSVFG